MSLNDSRSQGWLGGKTFGLFAGCGAWFLACAFVVILAVGSAGAFLVWKLYYPESYRHPTYELVASPDGAYVVILGSRSDFKHGYGAVWIASRAAANADEWDPLSDWSRGEASAEWLADRVVEIWPAKWNSPYPPDSVVHWRDVEVRIRYGVN